MTGKHKVAVNIGCLYIWQTLRPILYFIVKRLLIFSLNHRKAYNILIWFLIKYKEIKTIMKWHCDHAVQSLVRLWQAHNHTYGNQTLMVWHYAWSFRRIKGAICHQFMAVNSVDYNWMWNKSSPFSKNRNPGLSLY